MRVDLHGKFVVVVGFIKETRLSEDGKALFLTVAPAGAAQVNLFVPKLDRDEKLNPLFEETQSLRVNEETAVVCGVRLWEGKEKLSVRRFLGLDEFEEFADGQVLPLASASSAGSGPSTLKKAA